MGWVGRPFPIMLALFSAFFGKTTIISIIMFFFFLFFLSFFVFFGGKGGGGGGGMCPLTSPASECWRLFMSEALSAYKCVPLPWFPTCAFSTVNSPRLFPKILYQRVSAWVTSRRAIALDHSFSIAAETGALLDQTGTRFERWPVVLILGLGRGGGRVTYCHVVFCEEG